MDKLVDLIGDAAVKFNVIAGDVWPHVVKAYWLKAVMTAVGCVAGVSMLWLGLFLTWYVMKDNACEEDILDGIVTVWIIVNIIVTGLALLWAPSVFVRIYDPIGAMVLEYIKR